MEYLAQHNLEIWQYLQKVGKEDKKDSLFSNMLRSFQI